MCHGGGFHSFDPECSTSARVSLGHRPRACYSSIRMRAISWTASWWRVHCFLPVAQRACRNKCILRDVSPVHWRCPEQARYWTDRGVQWIVSGATRFPLAGARGCLGAVRGGRGEPALESATQWLQQARRCQPAARCWSVCHRRRNHQESSAKRPLRVGRCRGLARDGRSVRWICWCIGS